MKYGLIGAVMPLILDKVTYKYLTIDGVDVTKEFKRQVKAEYKAMVKRTPGLAKDNSLAKNLYIGCYLLAFPKAHPSIITEERFEGMIKAMCDEMDWVSTFKRGEDGTSYEFTYTKCGLCELGRREGCFHLIKYLCKTDYISYDMGGAKLVREHTIANGDEFCDFHV